MNAGKARRRGKFSLFATKEHRDHKTVVSREGYEGREGVDVCHSERSEESLIIVGGVPSPRKAMNGDECAASAAGEGTRPTLNDKTKNAPRLGAFCFSKSL
jgi:hypothetical protein